MEALKKKIDKFFEDYATRFTGAIGGKDPDIEGTVGSFSESFIEASPLGIHCRKNDEKFREVIPQGYAFYKSIGTRTMTILAKEISILDELHAMVKVHWHSTYVSNKNMSEEIEFMVYYLVQVKAGLPKIFAYITGDEQKVLKEKGLIPGN
ncbi:MAG TPA: hypothetical protein VGD22_09155 [Sphingobacteriaceae bacterium]